MLLLDKNTTYKMPAIQEIVVNGLNLKTTAKTIQVIITAIKKILFIYVKILFLFSMTIFYLKGQKLSNIKMQQDRLLLDQPKAVSMQHGFLLAATLVTIRGVLLQILKLSKNYPLKDIQVKNLQ